MVASSIADGHSVSWRDVITTAMRLLTFRATQTELVSLGYRHLVFGLVCTWIVGIGRHWDNPRVNLLQHLGVGSVIYVFVFATFLWLVIGPLRPKHWTYKRVVAFVSLVSPPAILYAFPIEKFYPLETADSINVWFLALVATWRVALLFFFLRRLGQLNMFSILVGSLLPLSIIVSALTFLNLDKAVFEFMGGTRNGTSSDGSYAILVLITFLSVYLFVPLLICYLVAVKFAHTAVHEERMRKQYE
jgi:hypothetical protein